MSYKHNFKFLIYFNDLLLSSTDDNAETHTHNVDYTNLNFYIIIIHSHHFTTRVMKWSKTNELIRKTLYPSSENKYFKIGIFYHKKNKFLWNEAT